MKGNTTILTAQNYDSTDKPVWYDDDIWTFNNLGVSGNKSDHYASISFKRIKQNWFKSVVKDYIYYCFSNKSCHLIRARLSSLVSFSCYLMTLSSSIQLFSLNDVTRKIILDYFIYLAQQSTSSTTRQIRILDLSIFFEDCNEKDWMNYQKKLIYPEDVPRRLENIPRFIPEFVLNQLNTKLDLMDRHIRHMIQVLQETGMRISEAIKLPFDCIYQDREGDYFLRYLQSKFNKEHVIPISVELAMIIKTQQEQVQTEWEVHRLLFPVPEYMDPIQSDTRTVKMKSRGCEWRRRTLSKYFNEFSEYYQIKDDQGNIWRFGFHQFRHTVATKMINHDVPQHIVQRFLGHESPTMTARYAHIMDQTLKKAFTEFNNKIINISGEVITPREVAMSLAEGTNPDDIDARWLKKNIMAQALPNGTCALPAVSNSCPHANACLTCVNFRTDHRYLNIHKQQLEKTKSIINQAKTNGWQRQIEMNTKIEANLEKIITALEVPSNDT